MPLILRSTPPSSRHILPHRLLAGALLTGAALAGPAWAQSASADASSSPGLRYGLSASLHYQEEPGVNWRGGDVGVHVSRAGIARTWDPTLEADIQVGTAQYRSRDSGNLGGTPVAETRWRALWSAPTSTGPVSAGLAFHTYYNDLQGTTSTGNAGYERYALQWWLPLRWEARLGDAPAQQASTPLVLDAGFLLWGRHHSQLSQAVADAPDVTNRQYRGVYLQMSRDFATESGVWRPFLRWTWLDDSKVSQGVFEPETHRYQIGVVWSPGKP